MLRHITQYADVLLEGRDLHTDHSMLRCVLIHACVHIVRARLRVLKHNTRLKHKLQAVKMKKAMDRERRLRKEAGLPSEQEESSNDDEEEESEEEKGEKGEIMRVK